MTRSTRSLVSLLCLFTVLFAQLAVSAYACPKQTGGMSETTAAAETTSATFVAAATAATAATNPTAGGPCDVVDPVPALCQKYCEDGQQNVSTSPLPLTIAMVNGHYVNHVEVAQTALPIPVITPSLHHATAPSLAIRHCCLRL